MQSFIDKRRNFIRVPYVYKYALLLLFLCVIPTAYVDFACAFIFALQGIENSYHFKLNWYEKYERIQCKMLLTSQVTIIGILGVAIYNMVGIHYISQEVSIGAVGWVALFVAQYITYLYDLQLYQFTKRMRIFNQKDVSFVGNSTI